MNKIAAFLLITALVAAPLATGMVLAATPAQTPNIVASWTFDSGAQGWVAWPTGSPTWWDYHTLTPYGQPNTAPQWRAQGAISAGGLAGTWQASTPGWYTIVLRAAQEVLIWESRSITLKLSRDNFVFAQTAVVQPDSYTVHTWEVYIPYAGPVQFIVDGAGLPKTFVDYVTVYAPEATPTAPLPTPLPSQPPTQAPGAYPTPMPVAPAYCREAAATYTDTVPITNTVNIRPVLEEVSEVWAMQGAFHPAAGRLGRPGDVAARLPAGNGLPFSSRVALIVPVAPETAGLWVDVWHRAEIVTTTTQLVIWWRDNTGAWAIHGSYTSDTAWRQVHTQVAGQATAIAFAGEGAYPTTQAAVFVDDIAIYSRLSYAPTCAEVENGAAWSLGGAYAVSVPIDRPCPAPVLAPDNFWGALMLALTRLIDATFQLWPTYPPGSIVQLMALTVGSPVGTVLTLAAAFVDIRPFIILVGLIASAEGLRAILSIIKLVKVANPTN